MSWLRRQSTGTAAARRGARVPSAGHPAARPSPTKRGRRSERGVALLIAAISFSVLIAVTAEFIYSSKVDLRLATNHRDDTRAYFLARSGVGLARLTLSFQKQLDNIKIPGLGDLAGLLGGAGGAGAGAAGAGAAAAANGIPQAGGLNIQLYKLARIDCYLLQAMVPPAEEGAEQRSSAPSRSESEEREAGFDDGEGGFLAAPKQRDWGGFDGCFDVQIDDPEETKININGLNIGRTHGDLLLTMLSDKQFEFLFEEEDANGQRVPATELLIHLNDWVDEDEVGSALDPNPNSVALFQRGFSDENGPYSRYEPRYVAKNAWMDSLDEMYMVHGVNDRLMAALRKRLTVYSDPNKVPNISTDDNVRLINAIIAVADPNKNPRLRDPLFLFGLIEAIKTQRMFSFLGTSTQDFLSVLQSQGLVLRPNAQQLVSDKASTFTLNVTGEAGAIKKKITAVVRMDEGGLGRLVYWREE